MTKQSHRPDLVDRLQASYTVRPGYWFAQKRFGLGSTPVTWQGWAVTILGSLLIAGGIALLPGLFAKLAWAIPVAFGWLALIWRKTDGGWQWNWGLKKPD
ncbi:hypothetical protein [Stakelama pacifica]|uniref:Uncharacterized protein n=1 Tax=Stakelama pacifica TaxID=517720 RepID=A0A4R6FDK0_9SPHN|nr:hypothetical protein [Stakelama pacifica]MAW99345.1 hypothetical protein [Sphingomonas sp.]TDN79232.1 hypothetical protein EV664_11310 [Stakelama pacifica]GGO98663.1 hypothetical protein GCM10011329_30370 [Stakelama pacifica]